MKNKVNCIMLVDDNSHDNFYHERVIKKHEAANVVISKESGIEALDYLKNKEKNTEQHPDVILLDINMPKMDGWEFLEEYKKLDLQFQSKKIVVMLTTSANPADKEKAESQEILADFKTKPLSKEVLEEVLANFK